MTLNSESSSSNYRLLGLLAFVVVLYLLGFNFYVPPNNGDDVVYYQGAVSLADGEGYKSQGLWIQDWPPVQSLLVAGTMFTTGNREYYVAKLVNLCSVVLALVLAHSLMKREGRRFPTLACLLIAVSPTSLLTGTGGQADFTFFALSMGYFLLLDRLGRTRSWLDAVLCGLVLGAATLTRWQGVVLGVGLVFQAVQVWRTPRRLTALREVLAAVIGAGMVLGWKYWLTLCVEAGTASTSNYDLHGASIWWQPAPLELGGEMLNVFTQFENVILRIYPGGDWLVTGAALLFWALLLHGLLLRIWQHGGRATDAYVLTTLAMYTIYAYKEARYTIPLAPFLLDYLFTSVTALVGSEKLRRLATAGLLTGLLAIDATVLFRGDGTSMGPRTQLLLSSERSFLRGYYVDLYDTCKELAEENPEAVLACDKFHTLIVRHYSGLETHFPPFAPADVEFDFFIEVEDVKFAAGVPEILKTELELPESLTNRLKNPQRRGQVVVWQVE